MGRAKERMMELQERGYEEMDTHVCSVCVTDPNLRKLIEVDLDEEQECSYCGERGAAPAEILLMAISEAIRADYTDPADQLQYETAEGGYQGEVLDCFDIFEELSEWTDNDELRGEVAKAFAGSYWCRRNYFGLSDHQILYYGWEGFVEYIKHRRRFFFLDRIPDPSYDSESIPPNQMLDALSALVSLIEPFCSISNTTMIYRVRCHGSAETLSTAKDLGTPPDSLACIPNRMSPAGIAMFYGALDPETAVLETLDITDVSGKVISIGEWNPTRALRMLDLTSLPPVPSDFDDERRELRGRISFLRAFAADITKPIRRDGNEHVEYVPTQVVSEYVRHRMRTPSGQRLDGILYKSSRQRGQKALVIFAEHEMCGPLECASAHDQEPLLVLLSSRRADPLEFLHLWEEGSSRERDIAPTGTQAQLSLSGEW